MPARSRTPAKPKEAHVSRLALLIALAGALFAAAPASASQPQYEPAYFDGRTVTINAIEVPQHPGPLANATADFYQVVYPPDTSLWPGAPQ
jgi:hypothetical protein